MFTQENHFRLSELIQTTNQSQMSKFTQHLLLFLEQLLRLAFAFSFLDLGILWSIFANRRI
jgi:hypothetical protein